jgi:hypothetical protein
LAIAYNLVRFEAERVAAEAQVPPTRVSFVAALTFIENALRTWGTESAGRFPERLATRREDQDERLPSQAPTHYLVEESR